MKTTLLLAAASILLCLGGCQPEAADPNYAGLPNVTYSVQQGTGSAAAADPQVTVSPNPFFDDFTVNLHAPAPAQATIYVTDEKGKYRKEIETSVTGYATVKVNFGAMPKGVYLCEVHLAGQVNRFRMIKAW
ncbi:T9SS type A sorting domain-containing protein [Pontibacter litorisediminis]|uniref:T9SS type A sorting domain-containing protein n=1 Tax=Pontibacter litorisediminis TaxID=1846260 RepID=UPI0023EBBEB9|nr:T9SS type A sorting domain-containing protein [Pontibacter litorisediminis]